MKARRPLFLIIILISLLIQPVFSTNDYGEDEDYLGQIVDDYLNDDYVNATNNVIRNNTLGCMELNYTSVPGYGYENFSTYTEFDENNRYTVTPNQVTIVNRYRTERGKVYKDMGAGHFSGDYEFWITLEINGGHIDSTYEWFAVVSPTHGYYTSLPNFQSFSLRTTFAPRFTMNMWDKGGAGVDANVLVITAGVKYYCVLKRTGTDLYGYVYSDFARTNLIHTFHLEGVQTTAWRYISSNISFDLGSGANIDIDAKCYNLSLGAHGDYPPDWGYEDGQYYTEEMLEGDTGLVFMSNASIPEDTGITIEFSDDNATWVDHNDQAGYDTLIAGFESLDLRDINTTSLYMRFNMTTTDSDITPRMHQLRLVTITNVTLNGNGEIVYVYRPEGWVLTIMIAAIGVPLIILGTRRRRR